MIFIKLYSGKDQQSHFMKVDTQSTIDHPLGKYSEKYPVSGLIFREFKSGLEMDWHTAPQPQYIIYLEGEVEVEASSGEKRIFKPGDILFATDLTGKGHITRTLSDGKSIIITTR